MELSLSKVKRGEHPFPWVYLKYYFIVNGQVHILGAAPIEVLQEYVRPRIPKSIGLSQEFVQLLHYLDHKFAWDTMDRWNLCYWLMEEGGTLSIYETYDQACSALQQRSEKIAS